MIPTFVASLLMMIVVKRARVVSPKPAPKIVPVKSTMHHKPLIVQEMARLTPDLKKDKPPTSLKEYQETVARKPVLYSFEPREYDVALPPVKY